MHQGNVVLDDDDSIFDLSMDQEHKVHDMKAMRDYLQSEGFEFSIILLIVIDIILVMIEITLNSYYPNIPGCTEVPQHVEEYQTILHYLTITILVILNFEWIVKMIVFKCEFFHKISWILDALLVSIALVVEIVYLYIESDEFLPVISLFILLLRILRIMQGLWELSASHHKSLIQKLKSQIKELQKRERKAGQSLLNNQNNEINNQPPEIENKPQEE